MTAANTGLPTDEVRRALIGDLENLTMEHRKIFDDVILRTIAYLRALTPEYNGGREESVAWCQPMDCGKHTPRRFLLYFDDPDHGNAVFDNEAEARAAYERATVAWNCYLLGSLPLAPDKPLQNRSVSTRDGTREALEAEIAETRAILAGPDIGSLPHDWTLRQVAEARCEDITDLRWKVRDTCARAEKAEAALASASDQGEAVGQPNVSAAQQKLDASVTPAQARVDVDREREALSDRSKTHQQPDGFINDYD